MPNNVLIQMQLVNQSYHGVMTHHSFSDLNHCGSVIINGCLMHHGRAYPLFRQCAWGIWVMCCSYSLMWRWEGQSVIYLMVWIIILVSFCVCAHDEKVSLESLRLNSSAPVQSFLIHSRRITDVAVSIFAHQACTVCCINPTLVLERVLTAHSWN